MSEENKKSSESPAPSQVRHLEHTVVKNSSGLDVTFKSTDNNGHRVLIHTLNLYFKRRTPEEAGENPADDQELAYALTAIKHTVHKNARDGSKQDEWSYRWKSLRPDTIAVANRGHQDGPDGTRLSIHDVEDRGVPLSRPFDTLAVSVALAKIDNPSTVLAFLSEYLPDELALRDNF